MAALGERVGDGVERSDAAASRETGLAIVAGSLGVMWAEGVVDRVGDLDLDRFGIVPRHVDGLDGILFSPFLHGGFDHLVGNTVPFALLGGLIALSGAARLLGVMAIVMVVGGLGTWLVAPENTVHIGASGLVFGFAAYLVARGVLSGRLLELAVGALVLAVWGVTLLQGLVPEDGISWQGHLFGAVGGVVAARVLAPARRQ
ncbi:rhomboid family intramembrane serine protease [Conexibacter sp. SYSU D00693]|uniref:rhomboid family intramembrane serine protease n=1 Tax=Conexibacter sp. SYSU D00693 TaxID=2812560 RepID=UPI00196A4B50|nr:rhomboid family intramembrane serine protease [Conexibacter sp. SYSU D00693]